MWLYKKNGTAEGPLDSLEMEAMIRMGAITGQTLVFTQGMATWLAAEKSALAGLFRKLPPPPPMPARQPSPQPPALPSPRHPGPLPRSSASHVPEARAKPSPQPATTAYRFKDLAPLTHWLTTLLIVLGGMHLIGVWVGLMSLENSRRFSGQTLITSWNPENLRLVPGSNYTLVYVATTVLFGVWIYRAARNLRALGASNLRFGPGMAVGSYFIPILNLFMPFQAMKEIWNASRTPLSKNLRAGNSLLTMWWTLWLITFLIDNMQIQGGPPLPAQPGTGINIDIDPAAWLHQLINGSPQASAQARIMVLFLSDMANSLLCIVAIVLVETVCARQRSTFRRFRQV